MLLFDSHLDLAWNSVVWERDILAEISEIRRSEKGQSGPGRGTNTVSLPELRRAEVGLFIATLLARRLIDGNPPFTAYETPALASQAARLQNAFYEELVSRDLLHSIHDSNDLNQQIEDWRRDASKCPLGYILSMEGADPIEEPDDIPKWWDLGLRIIGPAHYGFNKYTQGTGTEGGFTAEGRRLLEVMEQQGMILDVTHLADEAFEQALDHFGGPVLASHHNCRSLVPGQRQLSDEQIQLLVDRDAVIGVVFDAWMLLPGWKRGESSPSMVKIADVITHIDHICQIAGDALHVGIGSDLDGGFGTEQCPGDLDTITDIQKLLVQLESRGYAPPDIEGIFHRNWIDFFRRSWKDPA